MNIKEFLENPVGKGDASVNVKMITNALSFKYDKYTDRATGKKKEIKMKVFHQPMKDIYWIWLVIPSETERDNTYDVVYKFINPKSTNRLNVSISGFDIQIFANSPSFAYTYAFVYNKQGLLIPELTGKLGKAFMSKSPDTRNRNQVLLFDKYIYFGARYILDSKVLNRAVADVKASKYDAKYLGSIRTLDKIMDDYNIAKEKLNKSKKPNSKKDNKKTGNEIGVNRITSKKGVNTIAPAARKSSIKKKSGTIKKK